MGPKKKVDPGGNLMTGWKDIANYLNISVKTARVWAKRDGLPVLRTPSGRPVTWEGLIKEWLIEYNKKKGVI